MAEFTPHLSTTSLTAASLGDYLRQLVGERALAQAEGLGTQAAYMADLDEEIEAARAAYVGTAVTEIATLRAELSGPQVG